MCLKQRFLVYNLLLLLTFLGFGSKGFSRNEVNLGLLTGPSFTSLSKGYYTEADHLKNNIIWGAEIEVGISRLQALSIGFMHSGKGGAYVDASDLSYSYWEMPLVFVHHLPLVNRLRLSFRALLIPTFLSKDDALAPSRKFFTSAGFGAGISYEFIDDVRIIMRGELIGSFQSVNKEANNYFRSNSKLGEGRILFGISYNLNPDPLRKKERKIPECLK